MMFAPGIQRYCSDGCRETAQRWAHCEAQRRCRQQDKGRDAHRKAEAQRRMGRSKKNKKSWLMRVQRQPVVVLIC